MKKTLYVDMDNVPGIFGLMELLTTDPSAPTFSSGTSDPVQMTNWYHSIAFANKLSLAEGLIPVYAVTGVNFCTFLLVPRGTPEGAL